MTKNYSPLLPAQAPCAESCRLLGPIWVRGIPGGPISRPTTLALPRWWKVRQRGTTPNFTLALILVGSLDSMFGPDLYMLLLDAFAWAMATLCGQSAHIEFQSALAKERCAHF